MTGPVSVASWAQPPASPAEDSAPLRLWRSFASARVIIGAGLLALLAALRVATPGAPGDRALLLACVAYTAAAVAVRLLTRPPGPRLDVTWVAILALDLGGASALQLLQAGGLNFTPLLAVPVLMAAVLGSRAMAIGTAGAASLLMLAEAWLRATQVPGDSALRLLQAAGTGAGYLALALLAHHLAARLAREEDRARRSQEAARTQALVNALVIETLADGILVVDADGRVRAANPTACLLLGANAAHPQFRLEGEPGWQALCDLAAQTLATRTPQVREVTLGRAGQQRRVSVRTRAAGDGGDGNLCVMFLEDLREMEARLRTEKLAAMGRMSAAVAHEIRNPLAAITQANALLEEDLGEPAHRKLSALVGQNARRLERIVEEILNVSRVQQQDTAPSPPLALDASVATVCQDWSRQAGLPGRPAMALRAPLARVPFEPEHLRRVLVNLLDNASRYASDRADAIQVTTQPGADRAVLVVWSDGAPLEPAVQRHLFEPFFSSESRSSGLGLYICRELCERHGAQIGYRRAPSPQDNGREGNAFIVSFRPPPADVAGPSPATIPV
ncbi:sensor histidine kinase [Ramlibacter sp. MAHUQ-53]|uniref:sensor histidine kinase n=1 Tax=unclassified Ramlibacter TaxID=2617605 RepID=UPI00363C3B0A